MQNILLISEIVIPILLIASILFQQRGTALGSSFGGGEGGFYSTRRGIQKNIFIASIILAILFIIVSFLNLMI